MQEDTTKNKPGVYTGTPNSSFAVSSKTTSQNTRIIRTMREDSILAKKESENRAIIKADQKTAPKNFIAKIWGDISGKTKAEAEAAAIVAEKERIRAKEAAESERARLKTEQEQAAIAAEKELARTHAEAVAKAKEEAIQAKEKAAIAALAEEKARVEALANAAAQKEAERAIAKIAASPEGVAVRERATATVSTKAAEIIA